MFFQASSGNPTKRKAFKKMDRRRAQEDAALRALEQGLAFEENSPDDQQNSSANPHFEQAMKAFADIERQ
ncbi:MAG TPA: hypothetical protein VGN88_13435 [Phycisphaerae bacterium]|jgi:hypothetical protein